ncbi:sensor histidine kinase [Echinicola strongylocentroti]|uniref:Sensor histidine kinase n=1 Tax=Echinicola strongylocentroti TaxID=1795355 RepID=A0A2Z4IH02_9BACT|nr:tetratricopeptide repeat protein [Echinicola strongylocentroti]AWW30382.1 sensor histidine kinase [Echinicola strongylocentroti]
MKVKRHVIGCLLCTLLVFSTFCQAMAREWIAPVDSTAKTTLAQKQQDSLTVVNAIQLSRDIHRSQHNEETEYQEAEKAVSLSLELGDTLLYAQSLDNLGLMYRYHQRYEEAIPLHTKAFNLLADEDSASLSKMIYANNAGVASRYAEDFDKAVFYYLEALKIAESENNLRNIAIACNGLGNTLLHLPGRGEDAIAYFERSLEAERKRNNTLGIAMNYLSIGDYFTEIGEYQMARNYLSKLLDINKARKDTFGLGITYEYYGQNYFHEGRDLQKAANYFSQSKALFEKLGDLHKQADIAKKQADVYRKRGNLNEAIQQYNASWKLAEQVKNKGLIKECSYWLSTIYEQQGQFKKALEYLTLSQQYKDSVALMDQQTRIAAIEKRYAIEKKESQIELLEKDKALQKSQLESQQAALKSHQVILVLLVILLVSIVVIAFMQFRNIKAKKKANELLRKQNDQIKEQRDEIKTVNQQLESTFEELIQEQKNTEEKRIKLLESTFENRIQSLAIQSLESQMNPHFLFNGMNAVRWLVMKNKNEEAKEYIDTFARLLRMSLTNNRKKSITLNEELQSTSLYLKIERLRFDSEFNYRINISPKVYPERVKVPPKILQPLVENAIKHGLLPSRKSPKILDINVTETEEGVLVEVLDNGTGYSISQENPSEPKPDGTHLGLKLIEERLVIFNQQHLGKVQFRIVPRTGPTGTIKGTRAEIYIIHETTLDLA